MKTDVLRGLIRREMHRMFESDGYPIAADNPTPGPVSGGQSSLMQYPGAPMGGQLQAAHLAIMPNESREALQKWAAFCKWATMKYGKPSSWPGVVTQTAIQAGRAFEDLASSNDSTQGSSVSTGDSNLPFF